MAADDAQRSTTRRNALRLLGVGALAPLGVLFDAAHGEAQDGATRAALLTRFVDGHVSVEPHAVSGHAGARVVGLVDAEFRDSLATLLDFGAYPAMYAPWLQRVRVLSRAHGHARLYAELEPMPHAARAWVELDATISGAADGTHRVELTRRAGELPTLVAAWQLISTPGRVRTLASLELAVVPPFALGGSARASLDAARIAFACTRRAARTRCRARRAREAETRER